MTATIATNPTTGIEYYEDGPQEGQSVKLFVAVTDGQVRNPSGSRWPFQYGRAHDQAADYYELVPFTPIPFDPELFHVDDTTSGWNLVLKPDGAPDGHPQGTYERSENIKRRTITELKMLAKGYADRYNAMLWPQENGYPEKLQYAKEQVAANNRLSQFTNLIARHEKLLQASFHNDARLTQLYSEINAAEVKAITNAVTTTTTATLTFANAHGIPVGKRIVVEDLPHPFTTLNGSVEVTAVTTASPHTLAYALTGPVIATAAVTAGVVVPAIDFVVSQMATVNANGQQLSGWVNGIEE